MQCPDRFVSLPFSLSVQHHQYSAELFFLFLCISTVLLLEPFLRWNTSRQKASESLLTRLKHLELNGAEKKIIGTTKDSFALTQLSEDIIHGIQSSSNLARRLICADLSLVCLCQSLKKLEERVKMCFTGKTRLRNLICSELQPDHNFYTRRTNQENKHKLRWHQRAENLTRKYFQSRVWTTEGSLPKQLGWRVRDVPPWWVSRLRRLAARSPRGVSRRRPRPRTDDPPPRAAATPCPSCRPLRYECQTRPEKSTIIFANTMTLAYQKPRGIVAWTYGVTNWPTLTVISFWQAQNYRTTSCIVRGILYWFQAFELGG